MATVYHQVMTLRNLDRHDAVLTVSTRGTPNGVVALELKVTCPANHPTGITTALLRLITASDLHSTTKKPAVDMKSFLRSQTTTPSWKARQAPQGDLKLLSAVAGLYLAALREGLPPTKAIQLWSGRHGRPHPVGCGRPGMLDSSGSPRSRGGRGTTGGEETARQPIDRR